MAKAIPQSVEKATFFGALLLHFVLTGDFELEK